MSSKLHDKDHGWASFFKRALEVAKQPKVKVGVLADDSKGKQEREGGLTNAELAVVLHYGTDDKRIPARPFLTSTFDAQREELVKLNAKLLSAILFQNITVENALNMLGAKLATETKNYITQGPGVPPPNRPSTAKEKGSDRPLVDTGRLLNAITWAIEKKH